MTLIIAEKPSVGRAIAGVVGATKKEQGYIQGGGYIVSWAVGHLIQSAEPRAYGEQYAKIDLDSLPVIPATWIYKVAKGADGQFAVLKSLMDCGNVKDIICATDAGREGELIFRLIYHHAGCKKPFKRLWISSLEAAEIAKGMKNLLPGTDKDRLYFAASARQKADWLYGMNMTRLFSCQYGKAPNGYINIINIGRVQTPTVNFIVERQREIDNFIPKTYYSIAAGCGGFTARTKVNDKKAADEIIARCNGKEAFVTKLENAEKSEKPPLLFDLTSLQREANKLFGYSAQDTLNTLQSLYERKLATYPRTDSNYITDDMEAPTRSIVSTLVASGLFKGGKDFVDLGKVDVKAVVNNSKVSDHHAILPTEEILKKDLWGLPPEMQNIFQLICIRLFRAVYSPRRYSSSKVYLDIEGEAFTASGTQTLDPGFTAIGKDLFRAGGQEADDADPENESIPASLSEGDAIQQVKIISKEKQTTPPKPFTEGTLLAALEHADAGVSDAALNKAIKGRGIGTPATRAAIIEGTVKNGYVVRKGEKKTKTLHPTDKGIALIGIAPDRLKSAIMTAEWENKLSDIEAGRLTEKDFLAELEEFLSKLVWTYKSITIVDNVFDSVFKRDATGRKPMGACPRCGGDVYEGGKAFFCEHATKKDGDAQPPCNFYLYKEDKFFTNKGKALTPEIAAKLLSGERVILKGCKPKNPSKSKYDVYVFLELTEKYVNYKMEFINK